MKKKCILLILMLCLVQIYAAYAEIITSDEETKCGENCRWEIDTEAKTLTIIGSGEMKDYGWNCTPSCKNQAPWGEYSASINKIDIQNKSENEVFTSIGEHAFEYMSYVQEVVLPEGLKNIKYEAFNGVYNLTAINFPQSLEKIGGYSFSNVNVSHFVLPENLQTSYPNDAHTFGSHALESITFSGTTQISSQAFLYGNPPNEAVSPYLKNIICEDTNESCVALSKDSNLGPKVKMYSKQNGRYLCKGKFYDNPNDIALDKYIKKRIYTVEEAALISKDVNTLKIKYR